jgi:Tfp pilus assembly protein PilP
MSMFRNNRNFILMQAAIYLGVPFRLEASNIDKPAGALPVPKIEHASPASNFGLSKSKVVPLKRRMDLASGEAVKANRAKPKPSKISVVASADKSASMSEAKVAADAATKPTTSDGDQPVWDSANKRYDDQDSSNAVSKTLRVEDIIEPTIDYRYSSARRKNPFIPEVILSGKAARQRELSPNDVEIPIVSPLQAFAVARLAVIGVWETDNGIWKALIRTPATQGIEAKLGDPIGNSGGRLMTINPDSVVVREFSVRSDGTRENRDIPLYMGSDLPAASDDKVGGRLILRPGASQPEIVAPQANLGNPTDSVISASPAVVGGDQPGTLKTVETQSPVSASSEVPSAGAPNQATPTYPAADASSVASPVSSNGSAPSPGPPDGAPPGVPINPDVKVQSATPVMGGEQ